MPFSALVPKAMLTLFVCGAEFVVRHLLVIACKIGGQSRLTPNVAFRVPTTSSAEGWM